MSPASYRAAPPRAALITLHENWGTPDHSRIQRIGNPIQRLPGRLVAPARHLVRVLQKGIQERLRIASPRRHDPRDLLVGEHTRSGNRGDPLLEHTTSDPFDSTPIEAALDEIVRE